MLCRGRPRRANGRGRACSSIRLRPEVAQRKAIDNQGMPDRSQVLQSATLLSAFLPVDCEVR